MVYKQGDRPGALDVGAITAAVGPQAVSVATWIASWSSNTRVIGSAGPKLSSA